MYIYVNVCNDYYVKMNEDEWLMDIFLLYDRSIICMRWIILYWFVYFYFLKLIIYENWNVLKWENCSKYLIIEFKYLNLIKLYWLFYFFKLILI